MRLVESARSATNEAYTRMYPALTKEFVTKCRTAAEKALCSFIDRNVAILNKKEKELYIAWIKRHGFEVEVICNSDVGPTEILISW